MVFKHDFVKTQTVWESMKKEKSSGVIKHVSSFETFCQTTE